MKYNNNKFNNRHHYDEAKCAEVGLEIILHYGNFPPLRKCFIDKRPKHIMPQLPKSSSNENCWFLNLIFEVKSLCCVTEQM